MTLETNSSVLNVEEIYLNNVTMANGGVNYKHKNRDGVLFCAQGDLETPGGLVFMDAEPP